MIYCTSKKLGYEGLKILWTCVAWGSHPYNFVHWYNEVEDGINAMVPGLADVQPEAPWDFSDRLVFLWKNKFPDFLKIAHSDVLVVWSVNMWQIANMCKNIPRLQWSTGHTGGYFPPEKLNEEYIAAYGRNISTHIKAFSKLMSNQPGINMRNLIRLNDEKNTYLSPDETGLQNPHVRALNKGLEQTADQTKTPIMDIRKWMNALEHKTAMRDNVHPQPWVLQQWMMIYLDIMGSKLFHQKINASQFLRLYENLTKIPIR